MLYRPKCGPLRHYDAEGFFVALTTVLLSSILNFSMATLQNTHEKYIKAFSKGQITIPKQFRESLGIGDEFWLKMYIEEDKLVAEPMQQDKKAKNYANRLLKLSGDWFSVTDWQDMRKELTARLQ